MEVAGLTLIKRLALVIDDGTITKVFYPVFPPDRNAGDVLAWLEQNRAPMTCDSARPARRRRRPAPEARPAHARHRPADDRRARKVNFAKLAGMAIVYCYPWTGRPGLPNPPDWDDIPGAHGSTPQAEGFRDLYAGFQQVGRRRVRPVHAADRLSAASWWSVSRCRSRS